MVSLTSQTFVFENKGAETCRLKEILQAISVEPGDVLEWGGDYARLTCYSPSLSNTKRE